jgi:hypothetical protein
VTGSSTPVMYWASRTTLCNTLPCSDAASQDALNGAAVELFEDLRAHAESFQALLCDLFMTVLVCSDHERSLVLWTQRKLSKPLHFSHVLSYHRVYNFWYYLSLPGYQIVSGIS